MLHPLRRTRTSTRRSMDVTRAVGHGTYEHDCDVGQVTWLSPSSWDFDMYNCQHLLPAQRVHIDVKPR